jgi:hypothetical protein
MTQFWKIYHENKYFLENANKIFLENLPFKGYISMETDKNGKFPCLYGYS